MKIGIIGHGRFGSLWAKLMEPIGDVLVFDKQHPSDTALTDVVHCDLLFLLVPIGAIESVCKEIAPLLSKNTIVIDACSVKVFPATQMKQYLPSDQPIIATHPLFGPDSVARDGVKGKKIVIDPLRVTKEQQEQFESIIRDLGLQIIHVSCDEHDRQMATSQALVHLLGRALCEINVSEQLISTPGYESLLRIGQFVNNDTWELFYDMQSKNPYAMEMRTSFMNALAALNNNIDSYGSTTDFEKRD